VTALEWVVTTGRTVAEAQEVALDQLGVEEQEADIEVVQEPQTGLFGRLKVEAKVKARIRPTTPRAKVDRRDRRRRNSNRKNRKGNGNGNGNGNGRPQDAQAGAGASGGGRGSGRQGGSQEKSPVAVPQASGGGGDDSTAGEGEQQRRKPQGQGQPPAGSSGSAGGRSGRRRRGGGQQQGGNKVANTSASDQEAVPVADAEAQREAVVEFLGGLLTAMDRTDASVNAEIDGDGTIVAEVSGEELGLLVGPKGQTLQAMHELTRSVVQRRFVGESHARINLDVAGYRKRRAEALARFTRQLADDVMESGVSKALDPMTASDRKVVHDTINEIDGVRTFSEGDEPHRRVVIAKG
jgi:spoIIIJ-associated protein